MIKSIALIDRLSMVMDPEELPQLSALVEWAEDHGYYPEPLLAPVVGDDARWVYEAYLSLSEGPTAQAHAAGVTPDVRMRIMEAANAVPAAKGLCARWDAAVAAAAAVDGLPCAPWAAVVDVAMLLGWCLSRDLLCYVMLHGTYGARRAARAVMMLREGIDPMDVWSESHD
nr:MAG TPA: hypothetical protein [Caudoviricetes sp.]